MGKRVGIAGAAGGLPAFIFAAISLLTPNWIETEIRGASVGLWQICYPDSCINIFNVFDGIEYVIAALSFMSVGCFCLAVALGVSVIAALDKGSDSMPKILASMFSAAELSILIALSIFTANTTVGSGASYGYSYILGWVSFSLSLILCIGLGVATR